MALPRINFYLETIGNKDKMQLALRIPQETLHVYAEVACMPLPLLSNYDVMSWQT